MIKRGVIAVSTLGLWFTAFVVIYLLKEIPPVIKEEFGPFLEIEN